MVSLDHPLWAAVAILVVWIIWTGLRLRLPPVRKFFVITGRSLLILALAALASGTRIGRHDDNINVVFLWDRSDSLPLDVQDNTHRWMMQVLDEAPIDASWSVINFASDARPESGAAGRGPGRFEPAPVVSEGFSSSTDLERALRTAMTTLGDKAGRRRIVVASDLQETSGRARDLIWELKESGISVDVRLLGNELQEDVVVEPIVVPKRISPGAPFSIHVPMRVHKDTAGTLTVRVNGEVRTSETITIPAGHQRLRLDDKILESGGHRIDVDFSVDGDPRMDNNTSSAYTNVIGRERVLLIGSEEMSSSLQQCLTEARIPTDRSADFPRSMAEWNRYGSVIIVDKAATDLNGEEMSMVRKYVEELGGGLMMIGSERTFAAGGYYKTPIEDVLPVAMKPKTDVKFGTVAMAIVVDQSGSMGAPGGGGQTKMELANQGAAAALDLLHPLDHFGVAMVDTQVKWIDKFQQISDEDYRNSLRSKILANKPGGGGIFCYTGLKAAFDELQDAKATSKHIILYADGADSEQQNGCEALARDMVDARITLTTVSLGKAHDTPFLEKIARIGKGRHYITKTGADVKQIFTRETSLAGRRTIIEAPILSTVHHRSQLWNEEQGIPLTGYMVTALKEGAEMLLRSNYIYRDPQGALKADRAMDPIFARWHIGLGKSLAFTADAAGKLSGEFLSGPHYRDFWPRAVRWLTRDPMGDKLSVHIDPVTGRVDIRSLEGELPAGLQVKAISETARTDGSVSRLSGTLAEAQLDLGASGTTVVMITDGDKVIGRASAVLRGGRELRQLGPNVPVGQALTTETGGILFRQTADIWRETGAVEKRLAFPRLWYAWLAAIALLLDVCGRRFPAIGRREPAAVKATPARTSKPTPQVAPAASPDPDPLPSDPGSAAPPPSAEPADVEDDTTMSELVRRRRKRR